jgi:hypothetical protein
MEDKIILKTGDMIEYHGNSKAVIEKIRMVSAAKFVDQVKYNGKGDDIVLSLRSNAGIYSFWLKDNPIRILEEKKDKKKP